MTFTKATKFDTWLKLGIAGLPGAGKTYTALNIAKHMSAKRVALIDSEAGTASKYANIFDFDSNDLTVDDDGKEVKRPFDPRRYVEAIREAINSGNYDVLVIDGLTPEWDDQGGILQMVDELQRIKKMNTRDSWAVATPLHNELMNLIIRSKIHIICTMLAKKETVVEKDAHGRTIGKKIAMDPIQRDNVPRLFDVFGIMQDKEMIIDKTRCPEIDGQAFMKPGKDLADILIEWVKGDPIPERTIEPVQVTTPAPRPQATPARPFQPISATPLPQQVQDKSAEQQPTQTQPRLVTLTILKAGANRNYPKGEYESGWDALKEKIAEEFNIIGDITDELIVNDYNLDAQAFVKDAIKLAKAS